MLTVFYSLAPLQFDPLIRFLRLCLRTFYMNQSLTFFPSMIYFFIYSSILYYLNMLSELEIAPFVSICLLNLIFFNFTYLEILFSQRHLQILPFSRVIFCQSS